MCTSIGAGGNTGALGALFRTTRAASQAANEQLPGATGGAAPAGPAPIAGAPRPVTANTPGLAKQVGTGLQIGR